MPKNHISQIMPLRIRQSHAKPRSSICLTLLLPLLLLASCGEKETWLSCTENGARTGISQKASFYIKIVRKNSKIQANYIDAFNSTSATTMETPIAFNFTANIHSHPLVNRKTINQVFYSVDKQTLEFSKTIRYFDSKSDSNFGKYSGGISIQNAGICKQSNTKPQSLI